MKRWEQAERRSYARRRRALEECADEFESRWRRFGEPGSWRQAAEFCRELAHEGSRETLQQISQEFVDGLEQGPIADRPARDLYLKKYANAPPSYWPSTWAEAPALIKNHCRREAAR